MTATDSPPSFDATNASRQRRLGWRRLATRPLALLLGLSMLLGSAGGGVAYRMLSVSDPSPATGAARVIAQGVAPMLGEEVVWRAVIYRARPRDEARAVKRPLSFLVASDGPILLSNDNPDTPEEDLTPEARLAPGEAMMVPPGTTQQRASLTDQATEYIALELVPAADADEVGAGQLIFTSAPFVLDPNDPTGADHDLDLVSAVLGGGQSTTIPDVGQSVAILATDGAIDIIPSGGRRRTLQPGEGDVFTGEIEILPAANTGATTGPAGKRLIATQVAPSGGATFVAAVVGPVVPPAEEPTPTEVPTQVPVLIEQPTEVPPPPTDTPEPLPTDTPEPTWTPEPTPDLDSDDDGLEDAVEPKYGTDPYNYDTDADGLSDGEEVYTYGTSPTIWDSDEDGLGDGDEVYTYGTSPLNPNTDGDDCTDGSEVANPPSDPLVADCYIIG